MKSLKNTSILTALFALILSFTFTAAQAQETPQPAATAYVLTGEVMDAESGVALADAEISILGQDISVVSDEEGTFKLENLPAGEHTIQVKLEGYQNWEKSLTLDKDAQLKIKLVPEKK